MPSNPVSNNEPSDVEVIEMLLAEISPNAQPDGKIPEAFDNATMRSAVRFAMAYLKNAKEKK